MDGQETASHVSSHTIWYRNVLLNHHQTHITCCTSSWLIQRQRHDYTRRNWMDCVWIKSNLHKSELKWIQFASVMSSAKHMYTYKCAFHIHYSICLIHAIVGRGHAHCCLFKDLGVISFFLNSFFFYIKRNSGFLSPVLL